MHFLTSLFYAETDQSGFSERLAVLTTSLCTALSFTGAQLPLKIDLDVI